MFPKAGHVSDCRTVILHKRVDNYFFKANSKVIMKKVRDCCSSIFIVDCDQIFGQGERSAGIYYLLSRQWKYFESWFDTYCLVNPCKITFWYLPGPRDKRSGINLKTGLGGSAGGGIFWNKTKNQLQLSTFCYWYDKKCCWEFQ